MPMQKINKTIRIVSSTEARLSSISKRSRESVLAVLTKHYMDVQIIIVNNTEDLEALVASAPDLVFLGMKYIPDGDSWLTGPNKIWISQYLMEHGITHTGSGHIAHQLELSKQLAKQKVMNAGLMTSPYFVINQDQVHEVRNTGYTYPSFVKPTNRGGGVGIDADSIVHNFNELESKIISIAVNLKSDSLIENYLPGREFSVAILKDEYHDKYLSMPVELTAEPDVNGDCVISGTTKSSNTEIVMPVDDERLKDKLNTLALDVFMELGARDYGRIDIRLDADGVPHFLEANLLPSLISGYGSFPKACEINIGWGYERMILAIVKLAFSRNSDDYRAIYEQVPNFQQTSV
ncbi:hypothetical protein BH23PAT1_BH23PAT1_2150 [soil metagenome]